MDMVERVIMILEEVGRQPPATSLSAMARRTGLPKTTVHRLLTALEAHRAVERTGDRYRPGIRLRRLADAETERRETLRRAVMPSLVALYEQVNLPVGLAVVRSGFVVYLETLYGSGHSQSVLRTDRRAPAHCTAAGKALLAYMPELAVPYGVEGALYAMTENTITDTAHFATELARIRREGVAYNREEYVSGLVGIASPILSAGGGTVLGSVAILGRAGSVDFSALVPRLRRTVHTAAFLVRQHDHPARVATAVAVSASVR